MFLVVTCVRFLKSFSRVHLCPTYSASLEPPLKLMHWRVMTSIEEKNGVIIHPCRHGCNYSDIIYSFFKERGPGLRAEVGWVGFHNTWRAGQKSFLTQTVPHNQVSFFASFGELPKCSETTQIAKFMGPINPWHLPCWRHEMETFSALLVLCAGNSPEWSVPEQISKQSWGWWFETPSRSLWRHCNVQASDFQLRGHGRIILFHYILLCIFCNHICAWAVPFIPFCQHSQIIQM